MLSALYGGMTIFFKDPTSGLTINTNINIDIANIFSGVWSEAWRFGDSELNIHNG